jgi:CubicO group peptidase (beta-lactamase class C family)
MAKQAFLRCAPETQDISSAALLDFVDQADRNIREMHSFILLRHGQVVAEGWWGPYAPDRPHMLFSLTKSFTSTAVGLAVSEGLLSVDDRVVSFFPEALPPAVDENLAKMRVRHLLSMSTGHAEDATPRVRANPENDWVKAFLSLPIEYEPGTHFVYNSAASHMLSAIVQKLTGQKLADYLRPRLFEPLGVENLDWESDPRGINTGGWGLSITTEDIARFGQLYLQKGMWEGRRIVPEAWVKQATSRQISNGSKPDNDWEQGYGFQFWRCQHGNFRGDGAFGQYCVVMPEQDAVLAITSAVDTMQETLTLAWDCLLPAMDSAALPENPAAQAALARKLTGLALLPPVGDKTSPMVAKISGKTFRLESNEMGVESLRLEFSDQGCIFTTQGKMGEVHVTCGDRAWVEGSAPMLDRGIQLVAASGTWTAVDTYVITLRFIETPFYQTFTCQFAGDQLKIATALNVAFGPKEGPQLIGKMA